MGGAASAKSGRALREPAGCDRACWTSCGRRSPTPAAIWCAAGCTAGGGRRSRTCAATCSRPRARPRAPRSRASWSRPTGPWASPSGSPSSRMLAQEYGADPARILAAVEAYRAAAEPGRGARPAAGLRGAAPRAVPAHEHGPRRHAGDRRPAHPAAAPNSRPIPSWRRSTPTCTTCSAAGSIPASSPSPGSTGTARPRCSRSSCATRRSTGCARWRT